MQSRTTFADQKRMHRRALKTWILYMTCALSVTFSIAQTTLLIVHCGREFRQSLYIDPRAESVLMSIVQMTLSLVGIIGIVTKRGAVFFVGISFCICTVMIQHSVDLAMGLIYTYMYGRTIPTMELFLEKYYSKYEFNILARIKVRTK